MQYNGPGDDEQFQREISARGGRDAFLDGGSNDDGASWASYPQPGTGGWVNLFTAPDDGGGSADDAPQPGTGGWTGINDPESGPTPDDYFHSPQPGSGAWGGNDPASAPSVAAGLAIVRPSGSIDILGDLDQAAAMHPQAPQAAGRDPWELTLGIAKSIGVSAVGAARDAANATWDVAGPGVSRQAAEYRDNEVVQFYVETAKTGASAANDTAASSPIRPPDYVVAEGTMNAGGFVVSGNVIISRNGVYAGVGQGAGTLGVTGAVRAGYLIQNSDLNKFLSGWTNTFAVSVAIIDGLGVSGAVTRSPIQTGPQKFGVEFGLSYGATSFSNTSAYNYHFIPNSP